MFCDENWPLFSAKERPEFKLISQEPSGTIDTRFSPRPLAIGTEPAENKFLLDSRWKSNSEDCDPLLVSIPELDRRLASVEVFVLLVALVFEKSEERLEPPLRRNDGQASKPPEPLFLSADSEDWLVI